MMSYLSPISKSLVEKMEFNSLIERAKDHQLSCALEKINNYSNINEEIMDEIMPKDTPEVLLQKRHKIQALRQANKNADTKRIQAQNKAD